jgi:hypothetical protein
MATIKAPRRTVAGALVVVGLVLACLALIEAPALAGMRWESSPRRALAVVPDGQRLTVAAPVVSELSR